MGSQQSSQPEQKQKRAPVRRGHTIAGTASGSIRGEYSRTSENNSPGTSVCSDSEFPYISYTVNRPIGDSPKHSSKSGQKSTEKKSQRPRRQSFQSRKNKKTHDIVVVRQAQSAPSLNTDVDITRLKEIPTFLPIMRGTVGMEGVKDSDILEGLDCKPWIQLTARYQCHLTVCAQTLSSDQNNLNSKIREIDIDLQKLHAQMVEKQRQNARNAERLSRVKEISHHLTRCNSILTETLKDIEELNLLLPLEHRLEPFVWNIG